MGEIADMMLDGTLCQGCGVFLHDGGDGPGYPSYCDGCAADENLTAPKPRPGLACPHPKCSKRVKRFADSKRLHQHTTMVHRMTPEQINEAKQ